MLEALYLRVQHWAADPKLVPRVVDVIDPRSKLAVIGESLGPRTVRLSGVNYFDATGNLGRTGRHLDELLAPIGYTVYPRRDVRLAKGHLRSAPGQGRLTAYFTDMCPCFPGREKGESSGGRLSPPSRVLIESAWKRGFLEEELDIVKPRVILLLGSHTYFAFFRYWLRILPCKSLTRVVEQLTHLKLPTFRGATVVPFLHPSPANPSFLRWYRRFRSNQGNPFVRVLRGALDQDSPEG